MTHTTAGTSTIEGPIPGLVISSKKLNFVPSGVTPNPIPVKPDYAPAGASLERVKARARTFEIRLGGVLEDVVLQEGILLDGSGENFYAFDAKPFADEIDSFYLSKYNFYIPEFTALGLEADEINLTLNQLSNHPDLLSKTGAGAEDWLGSVVLRGKNLSIPTLPKLSLKAQSDGGDAFNAEYNLRNGDLGLKLARVAYDSSRLKAALTDAELTLRNGTKDISVKGNAELSMPTLGIEKIGGDLELKAADGRMKSLRGSISSSSPITALGLAGTLDINYQFIKKTGSITLTDGLVDGVKVSGSLDYANSGDADTDQITGQLTIDNSLRKGSLDIAEGLISLRPLRGSIDYDYRPAGAKDPGGTLKFTGIEADVIIGGQELPFTGSLDFKLNPDKAPTLAGMSLNLLRDAEFNLSGVGRVRLEGVGDKQGVQFRLAPIEGADGLWPTFSGKVGLDTKFGSAFARINSLTSMIDDEIGVYYWQIDGALGITA